MGVRGRRDPNKMQPLILRWKAVSPHVLLLAWVCLVVKSFNITADFSPISTVRDITASADITAAVAVVVRRFGADCCIKNNQKPSILQSNCCPWGALKVLWPVVASGRLIKACLHRESP